MTDLTITITPYTKHRHSELLRLLLQLHGLYFSQNAEPQLQELKAEKDINNSYDNYINYIEPLTGSNWREYIAETQTGKAIGFIIGSIETDKDLVLGKTGIVEDWFVEAEYRGKGIGLKLYKQLEKWFRENECMQINSDTWHGNQLSINAHLQAGFFISGVKFRKKL